MSLAEISKAIDQAPYAPQTEALLEKYVVTQLSSNTYDFEANKALLKVYQTNSSPVVKIDIITDVLTLALMRMPSTDYLALSYLVPGGKAMAANEKLSLVQKYAELLEKSQYKDLWTEYATSGASFANAVGFESAMRQAILLNMGLAFRDVDVSVLGPMLGLEGEPLKAFLSSSKLIETASETTVRFLANDENTPGQKTSDTGCRIDRMKHLFNLN